MRDRRRLLFVVLLAVALVASSAVPAGARRHVAGRFVVRELSPVLRAGAAGGQSILVRARTTPLAVCRANVAVRRVRQALPQGKASRAGRISWRWQILSSSPSGTWRITVTCRKGKRRRSATQSVLVVTLSRAARGAIGDPQSLSMPDGFIAGRGGDAICGPFNSPPEKQCTCLAWERRRDVYDTAVARGVPAGGPRLPGYYVWDGGQWLVNAQRAGIPTGPHPVAGALVVWGYPNTASYGHVAYVEQADSDTHVLVTECNYDWLGHCHTIWMNPQSQGRLQGYIYGGPAGNGPGTNTGGGTTSAPPPPPAGLNAWPYPIQPERTLRADFDGDGKADVAAFYAYNNAETGLWVWRSTSAPSALSFARPERPWDSGPGNWDWSRGKYFVGDFNGDGKADVGALYRYDNGEEGLWVWRSTSSPGTISFAAPVRVWDSGPGNWDGSRAMPIVGDFDGDGKADVGAFYRYDNSETGLWTWRSTSSPGSITFDPPHRVWDSGPGNWDGSRVLPFAGDFDGDGKADVGTLYRYDNSETGLWTWHSTSAPGSVAFAPPQRVWDSGPGNWDGSRAMPFVGDFDGDGKADVGALYRYDNNDTGLWTWRSNGTGFDLPTRDWDSGSGNWDWTRTLPMPGDFDGDGKTDLAALYTYDNAEERLWAWRASGTGTIGFSAPTVMWDSGAGNWDGSRGAPG